MPPRTDIKKTCAFKRDWTVCPNYDNHSRLNSQHDWEDLYDHSMNTRITNKIIIEALEIV